MREAFDAFHEKLGGRLDGAARESVEKIREAAAAKDAEGVREQMGEVKERHGFRSNPSRLQLTSRARK